MMLRTIFVNLNNTDTNVDTKTRVGPNEAATTDLRYVSVHRRICRGGFTEFISGVVRDYFCGSTRAIQTPCTHPLP